MTETVELRPGLTPLADWRALYRGAAVALDPIARADVEAGHTALASILSQDDSAERQDKTAASPAIAELMEKHGEPLPHGLLRLFVALKLASLAQGMSGVRWSVLEQIAGFLSQDLLPVVTAEDTGDRIALARLFGALTGTGEVLRKGKIRSAQRALKKSELSPLKLNPRERAALLSGAQLSLAAALAGLFEAERVFQSSIITATLSAAGKPGRLLDTTAHRLHRQRGQAEVAGAFRQLLAGARTSMDGTEDHPPLLWPIRLGACLDLLRHAGALLERAANSVTEDRLVLWQNEQIIRGTDDLSSVSLAADIIAQALRTVGDLSEARLSTRDEAVAPAASKTTGGLKARVAAFVTENRERARPTAFDASGVWRLLPMAGTAALTIAVEILEATRASSDTPDGLPTGLRAVMKAVSDVAVPESHAGAAAARNLASVGALVGSGALLGAAGVALPSLTPPAADPRRSRLGDKAKRT